MNQTGPSLHNPSNTDRLTKLSFSFSSFDANLHLTDASRRTPAAFASLLRRRTISSSSTEKGVFHKATKNKKKKHFSTLRYSFIFSILPCEASNVLHFFLETSYSAFRWEHLSEGKDQALYYDAHVLDAQRRRHDVRGCRCTFLVRYDHDLSEEIVPLRKVCRRPETDYWLHQLQSANDMVNTDQKKATIDPTKASIQMITVSSAETVHKQPDLRLEALALSRANISVPAKNPMPVPKEAETSSTVNVGNPSIQASSAVNVGNPSIQASSTVNVGNPSIQASSTVNVGNPSIQASSAVNVGNPSIQASSTVNVGNPSNHSSSTVNVGNPSNHSSSTVNVGNPSNHTSSTMTTESTNQVLLLQIVFLDLVVL